MSHVLAVGKRLAPVALLLATTAAAQSASYSYFGTAAGMGCSPVGAPVQHTAVGTPQLGSTFTVNLPASNGDCGYLCNLWFLATGFSNTSFNGVPLPYTPPPFGSPVPTCGSLRVSLEYIELASAGATTTATAQLSLTIPNNPNLVGLDFYQQPFTFTFTLGGLNAVALGRGGHGTIGY